MFELARPAFSQWRTFSRAQQLGLSAISGLGRKTITGLLCAAGMQFRDWSASYRLFTQQRLDRDLLMQVPISAVVSALPPNAPVVSLIDDTIIRKRGRHVAGTSWRRDPLGPAFADNFVWANRFLQISLALPEQPGSPCSLCRAIPVDFTHAPSPRKPNKKAPESEWADWRKESAASAVSSLGAQRLHVLRQAIDAQPNGKSRSLWCSADGTFTNRSVFKDLPERTVLIGRVRKDAKLFSPPTPEQENHGRGRQRAYGSPFPTPEQVRQDESIPWEKADACAAGKQYTFDVKLIAPVRWKAAGAERSLSLLIVRPISYRLRRQAKLDYHAPVYLLCTDPTLTAQQILQAYLWRWEIEVNFRDEKTLLGVGQAQVRKREAVESTACFGVFSYSLLLLAMARTGHLHSPLPRPLWIRPRPNRPLQRISTSQGISMFRSALWSDPLLPPLPNKNDFVAASATALKNLISSNPLASSLFYAQQ